MAENTVITESVLENTLENMSKRRLKRRASLGALAAATVAGVVATTSSPAQATNQGAGPADTDILNFALNLEYLEAQYYLYAVTGAGLPADLLPGRGRQGTTGAGQKVPFKTAALQGYAQRITLDELTHVRVLRAALGSAAVAIPDIDVGVGPNNTFSKLAQAAGLVGAGQLFNPYADENSFLLGAAVFEDVGVTAYAGAARFIGNPDYVEVAAAILAVEAYHSGGLRTLLIGLGLADAFDKIATVRATLSNASGQGSAEGPLITSKSQYDFVPTDTNGLAFRRSTRQVLNIVYGTAGASKGGFFPQGMNGAIAS